MKKLLTLITVIIFCNSNLKAQDDPNVGFYVDGVKVTELNCYSFKKFSVVFPYDPAYENYDRFVIKITEGKEGEKNFNGCFNVISKASLLTKVKGKYIVYDILKDGEHASECNPDMNDAHAYMGLSGSFSRGSLARYEGKEKPEKSESEIWISIGGETIDGVKEKLDQGCNCIKKINHYKFEQLGNVSKLKLTNKTKVKGMMMTAAGTSVDMTQPCTYPGTKVDFNSLGGKSSSGNTNTKTGTDKKKDAKKEDDDDKDE